MQLRRLRIERFRAFEHAEVELPSRGLLLVAGANNSGKSALLSAIDVVAGKQVGDARHHNASERAVIEAEYALSRDERAALLGEGPHLETWLEHTRVGQRLVVRFAEDQSGTFFLAAATTENPDDELEEFASTEARSVAHAVSWKALSLSSLSHVPDPMTSPELSMRANAGSGVSADGLRQGIVGELLARWSTHVYHFNAIRPGAPRQADIGVVRPDLDPSGANLAQCLAYHYTQGSPIFDQVRATMASVLPDAGTLVVPMSGTQVEIAFVDPHSGDRRNLKDLGSGVEQLLMIAYVGLAHPTDGLVLMEEPETSLHPGAQRELMRRLLEWARDHLFVATTHSPVFLDERPADEGATILVTREDGASIAAPADGDLRGVLHAVGVQLSDVLSASQIVLAEGESDVRILQAWFPRLLVSRRCAIVSLGGSDRAYQLDTITRVLDGVDALGRDVLFVRDRDEIVQRRLDALTTDSRILLLQRREVENYLLDDLEAILAALHWRARQPSTAPEMLFSAESLAVALREEADRLQPVVILKRVVEEHVPPRLLDRAAVKRIAAEDPSRERLARVLGEAIDEAAAAHDELERAWTEQASAVQSAWDAAWTSLAPGADVLAAVWKRVGLRYDKAADGARIAAAMEAPPAELSEALEAFLTEEVPV